MRKIGITGGIATGKSTVTNYLIEKGYVVIDADKGAREVVKPGQIGYSNVKMLFGQDILLPNQEIDRKKLGNIVFADAEKRRALDSVLHPLIFNWVAAQLLKHKDQKVVFIDMPLLFESGYHKRVDETWLVYAPEQVQLERLMARDQLSQEEAMQRIHSQWSTQDKRDYSTVVINNISTVDDLYRQIDNLLLFP